MWKSCRAALGALLLSVGTLTQAAAPVHLDAAQGAYPLAGHLEWLVDPGARMTLAQAQSATGWETLPGMPNAGYTDAAIWVRLTVVQSTGPEAEWRLSVDDVVLDEAQLFSRGPDGFEQIQRAGRAVAREDWPLATRIPTFRLRLHSGEQTLYLRLHSRHTLAVPLRLHSLDGYIEYSTLESLAFGGYFGIFAVVILLQLVFLVMGRDIVSIWYLLYTLVMLVVTLLRSGYPQLILGAPAQSSTDWLIVITILSPSILARLSAVWMALSRNLPKLNVLYQGGAYATGLFCMGLNMIDQPLLSLQLSQFLTIFWLLMSTGMALWLHRRRQGEAGYYVLVFSAIDLGVLVRFMHNVGWLPVHFLTYYAIFIGTGVHMLLMSLYFLRRYNKLQTELRIERRAREEQKEFVGMVSHEFRTPLAIINTSIQQLAANLEAPPEKSLQRAKNIREAVQRMNLLLDDYLSLDRMDSARQPVRTQPCDFYEVIEEAAADWPLGRVRIRMHDLPTPFICDPDLMRIVLRNLLANAVRHSPEDTMIELEASGRTDGGLLVRVQDWGEGIPPDELPKLFQRYFRGRASQGKPGAGLGLHLVQRIVQAHGGTISVQSTPGQGSTFTVTLPPGRPAKD